MTFDDLPFEPGDLPRVEQEVSEIGPGFGGSSAPRLNASVWRASLMTPFLNLVGPRQEGLAGPRGPLTERES